MNQSKIAATLAANPKAKISDLPKEKETPKKVTAPEIVANTTAPQLPPIEARLKKLSRINELAERRELLLEGIENLGAFYIAPDGSSCNLRLQDSKGKTFAITHPSVIGEIVSLSKSKLQAELDKVEGQIDFQFN